MGAPHINTGSKILGEDKGSFGPQAIAMVMGKNII